MAFDLRAAALAAALVLPLPMARPGLAQTSPTYTNARVLSFDVQNRLIRVRLPDGSERTAELDDNVAGLADIAVGDSVVLALRGEPGRPRVSRIVKGGASPAAGATPLPAPGPGAATVVAHAAEAAYRDRLSALAREADAVDRLWNGFKTPCKAEESAAYAGARAWLLLWDDPQAADLSSGFCRDLFNQIVDAGTTIADGLAAADEAARRSVPATTLREIRGAYSLDGVAFGRTPPKRLEP